MDLILDFIFILFYLILGFYNILRIKNRVVAKDILNLKFLLFYHLIFGVFYYFYTVNELVDSYTYWSISRDLQINSISELFNSGLGTEMIVSINFIPFNIIGLSYFQGTLMYSFLGFLGFLYLYLTIKNTISKVPKFLYTNLFPLLLFLPNLHFWSAGIGKDTISFLCINYIIYYLFKKRRNIIIIIPLFFLFIVRPHMIVFLVLSFSISTLLQKSITLYKKVILLVVITVFSSYIILSFNEFVGIDNLSSESISEYSNLKSENLSRANTGSAINLVGSPIYLRVFTFLFRPLFFDANNIMGIVLSFENLFLLLITIKVLMSNFFSKIRKSNITIKGFFIFCLLSSISFSLTLGNLGIMTRMKNMIMPVIILILLWALSIPKKIKIEKNN